MFIAKVYFETNTKEKFKKGMEVPADIAAKYPIRVEEVTGSKKVEKVEVIKEVVETVETPLEELLIETPVEVETEVEVIEEPKKKGKKRK